MTHCAPIKRLVCGLLRNSVSCCAQEPDWFSAQWERAAHFLVVDDGAFAFAFEGEGGDVNWLIEPDVAVDHGAGVAA